MSELTDLEIRKEISLIELNEQFPNAKSIEFDERQNCFWVDNIGFTSWPLLDPLADDGLCFRLMVKYDMPPMKSVAPNLYECVFDINQAFSGVGIVYNESPNKAIILAIIEASKKWVN